jgi:excisionase family DNA binding protein
MKKKRRSKEKQKQGTSVPRLGLSLAEAAERTGVSRYTLRRMIDDGTLAAANFRNRIVIPAAEIERLLKPGNTAGAAS